MCKEDYDLDRQLSVIQTACKLAGVTAVKSGRNDLLADGRKFSGNAFYQNRTHAYHHGTLMVDVDREKLRELTGRMQEIMHEYTGNVIDTRSGSTDANSALALGIPSVTIGAMHGMGAHTRGEWVDLASLPTGQKIALATVMQYFK